MKNVISGIEWFFGFQFKHLTSFDNFVRFMYQPRNSSSLGFIRIIFGILMILDTLFERSGLQVIYRWGDSHDCHFPLFSQINYPGFFVIAVIYSIMIAGAFGIVLGYKFHYSTLLFCIPYWYLLILDKTYWNNHSYLFGLVSMLLVGSSANTSYSIDAFFNTSLNKKVVPFWNYFILRFQFFILYFVAGLKKIDIEWLGGHAMTNLGYHWIFAPFKVLLSVQQIDYIIVHLNGFLLDLTIGFWLISPISRRYALFVCTLFHLMNSRLFNIGMFPYVCIATLPIFCNNDWPEKLKFINMPYIKTEEEPCSKDITGKPTIESECSKTTFKQRASTVALLLYCVLQFLLPYSHSVTKGYNNWTNGLYGYSWDMMVHSWDSALVVLRVADNSNQKEYFIDPDVWTQNQRWNKYGDMCVQYAECLKNNLIFFNNTSYGPDKKWPSLSNNISIYIDVWCSLNGRFQQRMFNPNYDLLNAKWSPFEKVEWLLPLMTENTEFRSKLKSLEDTVYSWSNYSDVIFVADFPGMYLENYLTKDLVNVTLTVLGGNVTYQAYNLNKGNISIRLTPGLSYIVLTGQFHRVYTNGKKPSLLYVHIC
ncbi:hypothetical protein FQA39_LY12327 [Lamprigera yunnana]|nr:hypothetical protein FQA39_LY12327 [Lamprigera yunnana]